MQAPGLTFQQAQQVPGGFAQFPVMAPNGAHSSGEPFLAAPLEPFGLSHVTAGERGVRRLQHTQGRREEEQGRLPPRMAQGGAKPAKVGKHVKNAKVRKKVLIGPKNNQIDLEKILRASHRPDGEQGRPDYYEDDEEVLSLTTLMIKNIPVKFLQGDMLTLIDKNFTGK